MVAEDGSVKLVMVALVQVSVVMVALVALNWVMTPLEPRIVEDAVLPIVLAVSVTRFALVPVMVVIDALPPVKVVARRLVTVPLAMLAAVMLALPYPSVVPDKVAIVADDGNTRPEK